MLVHQGLEVFPEDLIITNGSQQGLSLAMNYYVQPGYRAMRLTFCLPPEEIEQGISIVGKLLKKYISKGCVDTERLVVKHRVSNYQPLVHSS